MHIKYQSFGTRNTVVNKTEFLFEENWRERKGFGAKCLYEQSDRDTLGIRETLQRQLQQ